MDRKSYMREVYSKYWITARERIYGFLKYDKNLCSYICTHAPIGGRVLEVAIGTGYPFAEFLQKIGYSVYGIDISPELIEKCKKLYPNINCKVGDAENLEFPDNYFDAAYCFHSTWYFPDLNKAVDEMIRVTHPGGLVIFDIQNRNNQEINNAYQRNLAETKGVNRIKVYIKNVIKLVLRRGVPNWYFIVHEVPTYPESVCEHLKKRQLSNFQIMVTKEDGSIELTTEVDSFKDFKRLIFSVKK